MPKCAYTRSSMNVVRSVQHLVLASTLLLLLACGGGGPDGGTTPGATEEQLRFKAEMDSAKDHMRTGQVEKAEALGRSVFERTTGDPTLVKERINALSLLGHITQRRMMLDSALAIFQEGLRLAESIPDTAAIGTMWLNVGVVMEEKGEYEAALEAQLNALRWKELVGEDRVLARVLHNLSVLYWRQDSMDQALRLIERSVAIKRVHDTRDVPISLNGMGLLLMEVGKLDTALLVLKESLTLEDSINLGAERQVQLLNIGLAYERMGQLDSAAFYYAEAYEWASENEDPLVMIRTLYGAGDVRRAQGRYAEAQPLLDSSLAMADRIVSLEDMKEAHISLVMLHEQMGNPQVALDHFRQYHDLSDSLMNAQTSAAMDEMRLRYDTEKKDRENQDLRATAELSELRAARDRWIAAGMGLLAISLAALGWTIVQRNKQRAHQREAELEQQALRLQMDPHFLFNALNTIPGLYASGDPATANDHVGHLSKFLRLVLETSRRRTIPLAQEIELVEHYLRISANRRPDKFTWEVKVMPYVRPERLGVPPMLIQPVVENALEHGFNGSAKGHLCVLVDLAGSVLHVEVLDNGIGHKAAMQRPSRRNGNSMGIDLVRQRIMLFDKQANVSDAVVVSEGSSGDVSRPGTTVTLRFRPQQLTEHAEARDRG